jgi:NAD(P)-dependent dehydrogenase (short-subunit alcohol dehydrogenase family)
VHCDVASYDAQRQLFHGALSLLLGGILNTVVANAGVGETYDVTKAHSPASEDPPEPDMTTIDVNVKGVLFTSRLALHHFQRNPPGTDRHLLLVGSMASLVDTCGVVAMYATSKHAVLGWFRSLRLYPGAHNKDVRINLICPYFVATPIIPTMGRVMLAGMDLATTEDVVEAAARLVSESRARGRVLAVMPRKAGGISEIDETDTKALEQFSNRVIRALEAESRIKSCMLVVGDLMRLLGLGWLAGALGLVVTVCWLRCS